MSRMDSMIRRTERKRRHAERKTCPFKLPKDFMALLVQMSGELQIALEEDARKVTPFKPYRRKQIAYLRRFQPGETLSDRVSISPADREAGSPKAGDMIARNPKNSDDQWLVAAAYFVDNFEEVTPDGA